MDSGKLSLLIDTSPEAEGIQLALLRKFPPAKRSIKTFSLSHDVITLSKRAIQRQNLNLSDFEIELLHLHYFYGPSIPKKSDPIYLRRTKMPTCDLQKALSKSGSTIDVTANRLMEGERYYGRTKKNLLFFKK